MLKLFWISALFLLFGSSSLQAQMEMPKNKTDLTFAVISDIHVQAGVNSSQQKMVKALRDLHRIDPKMEALVINGDLGNGKPADYRALAALLKAAPHPGKLFYTIGNHEFYQAWFAANGKFSPQTFPNGETDQASIQRFLQFTGQTSVFHDEWVKGYHFILLGSEYYRQSNPDILEDAFLSSGQLHWLENALKLDPPSKPVFVFLHQPLPDTVSGSSAAGNRRAVVQHEQLKRILSAHPNVFFFSGHTHWQLGLPGTIVQDKFTMVNSSSVFQPVDDKDQALSAGKSEGLVVEVANDNVTIKGRDFYGSKWIPNAESSVKIK